VLEYAPRDPDHAAILSDLDPELDGLPIGIPAGILGEGEENMGLRLRAERNATLSPTCLAPTSRPRRQPAPDLSEIEARRVAALFVILALFGWAQVSEGQGLTTYDPYSPDNRGK